MFRKVRRVFKFIFFRPPLCSWESWLRAQGVEVRGKITIDKKPTIIRWGNPQIVLEDGVVLQSNPLHNDAGIIHPCTLSATNSNAILHIGKNSGLSGAQICCTKKVWIGNHVMIGANVTIYDCDHHHIDPYKRIIEGNPGKSEEVIIEDYAWLGVNAIILKGVHVGRGAVIGACSVVTTDVPPMTVFAGNPAKYIKKIDYIKEFHDQLF